MDLNVDRFADDQDFAVARISQTSFAKL